MRRFLLPALLLLATVPAAWAYQRITVGSVSLYWPSSWMPVRYLLQEDGSADIGDDSEWLAIHRAFEAWEEVPAAGIDFAEDTTSDPARTDFASADIHLIWFDENDDSGYFAGASGTIAVTPITYNVGTGAILDADIIFNGDDHSFSTDKSGGTFDVQSIATHEVGHFLGLDHAASLASTMYPYAETARTVARSLTADDIGGVSEIYPSGGGTAAISGFVVRSSDSVPITGAHVIAMNDQGVVVTTTLSGALGTFILKQLPADDYLVLAEPLDGPVTGSNLASSVGGSVSTNFSSTYLGGNSTPSIVTASAGSTTAIGLLSVANAASANLTTTFDYPYTIARGSTTLIAILGSSIGAGDTVSVGGTGDVAIASSVFVSIGGLTGFVVTLNCAVNAVLGPRNVFVTTSGGVLTLLAGMVEIVETAPTLGSLTPSTGAAYGGETVTVSGGNFQAGAIVDLGDAEATAVTFVSSSQLTITTPANETGSVKVKVQNPDGQVAVLANGFTFLGQPAIATVMPVAGSTSGNTQVAIGGAGFEAGATVTFGGSPATNVTVAANNIGCRTPSGSAGAVDVVVTNPNTLSDTAAAAYTYVPDPDPTIDSVSPDAGPTSGGTSVSITGGNFLSGAAVHVGQAADGTGGTPLASVTVVSSSRIDAVMPAASAGSFAITVTNPTGAAVRVADAYTYQAPAGGGGGGGGGCFFVPPVTHDGSNVPPSATAGALLPYVLLLWLLHHQHSSRRLSGAPSRRFARQNRLQP